MLRAVAVLFAYCFTLAVSVQAQNYSGVFSATNDQGGQTVVSLQQSADGSVTGSITGNGNAFRIEGLLEEGSLVGAVTMGQQGGLWFEAALNGNQLELTLIEPDANGMPNYSTATTLQFMRTETGNPHQGSAEAARKPVKGKRQDAGNVVGSGSQPMGATGSGNMSSGDSAGGLDDGTALGREWSSWLAGNKVTKMDSYSSGSAGGYSMRIDTHLCSTGEFTMYDQSSVSVDVGGASGYSGGNGAQMGRWRIITQGQVIGIELRYNSGQAEVYQLTYEGGATYADGGRVYVTPSDVCR